MAARSSKDVAFALVGGYDVLGSLTDLEDTRVAVLERTDALGDAWEEHTFAGQRSATLTQSGFFDDAAFAANQALVSGLGVNSRVAAWAIAGTATGAEFEGWAGAIETKFELHAARGELHKARAEYRNVGPVELGRVVRSYGAAGATGASTGTPLDNGASSTGVAGYLLGNAAAGESNIRILDSADNITYATLLTFTKTSSGVFAERLTTTGAAQRYIAADITTASATGSIANLNLFVGLVRGLSS